MKTFKHILNIHVNALLIVMLVVIGCGLRESDVKLERLISPSEEISAILEADIIEAEKKSLKQANEKALILLLQ